MERILKRIKKSESEGSGGGLTRRLCGKGRRDNELYRSNSFKFERFDKSESQLDLAFIGKQNKRFNWRPNSRTLEATSHSHCSTLKKDSHDVPKKYTNRYRSLLHH